MPKELLSALEEAVKDLLYMSESDEPFEVVHWKADGPELEASDVLKFMGKPAGAPIEVVSLDSFFKDLVQEKSWHGDEEKEDVRRYRKLLELLKNQMSETKVFRVGETQVDILIAGRTQEGEWAGLRTKAVET